MSEDPKPQKQQTGFIFLAFLVLFLGMLAVALKPQPQMTQEQISVTVKETTLSGITLSEEEYTQDDLLNNIDNFVQTPLGGVNWKVFGKTEAKAYKFKTEDGYDMEGVRPEFTPDIKALDGNDILIQGYMFPLDQEEDQKLFLIGPFPLSCPFHYHVSANLIIEVHAKDAIPFSYDAINVSGKLELVPQDDEYNMFYRLKNAKLVK